MIQVFGRIVNALVAEMKQKLSAISQYHLINNIAIYWEHFTIVG
jgi:hypothetical protein